MRIKIFTLVLLALTLSGCRYGRGVRGNGHVVEKEINVSNFERVDLSGIYSVDISIGDEQSVSVKAEENLMKYLKVKVSNNTLIFDTKRNLSPRKGIKAFVVLKSLKGINASGASFAKAENIDAANISIDISGASKVEISGSSDNLELDVSGAAKLYAKNFVCKKISADVSGAGNAVINVIEKLYADVSGAGSLNYYGNPNDFSFDTSGAGSIKKK